jgi:hypothetical protein
LLANYEADTSFANYDDYVDDFGEELDAHGA